MKYYIICGERSGDLHASNLVRGIMQRDSEAAFRGVGGDQMKHAGVNLFMEYGYLSFMGFVDVILHAGRFRKALKNVRRDILSYQPDAIIFVDFAAFNLRIAPFTHRNGIRSFYYISPKLWAWNVSRAKKVKKFIDRMFVILPFEKQFYAGFDYDVDYVGNPVRDALDNFTPDPQFREQYGNGKKTIALLPGSRLQEVRSTLPVFREVVKRLPEYTFLLAAVRNLQAKEYNGIRDLDNVHVVEEQNYDVLSASDAALVTSGTATLETCLLKVPQAVVYRTSFINWLVAKMLMKVEFISLVNLIAGREVVKEYLQFPFTAENCLSELSRLLDDAEYRNGMFDGYDQIERLLGDASPSDNTARLIVEDLKAK